MRSALRQNPAAPAAPAALAPAAPAPPAPAAAALAPPAPPAPPAPAAPAQAAPAPAGTFSCFRIRCYTCSFLNSATSISELKSSFVIRHNFARTFLQHLLHFLQ